MSDRISVDDDVVVRELRAYQAALEAGERPDRAALLDRFPEIRDELCGVLDGLEFVHHVAPAIRDRAPEFVGLESAASLGDFRIVREIGRGGMGVVYEATQLSLGRRVALKVLPFASVLDQRYLQRFKNEAQAAAQLHHSHIVPVYAVGHDRGVHYYAMQYIEGPTLADLIDELRTLAGNGRGVTPSPALAVLARDRTAESALYCRAVAELGIQAAEALDYAHESGVIHRDIKPPNLIVDARGHLWITDFGLASTRNETGLTMTGDMVGTLRYMSPEQASTRRVLVDHRTDVYSLAVTLYELLTLQRAFPGDSPGLLMEQIATREPARPRALNPATPPELETILGKAMAKDPADRYDSAGAMARDLRRFLEDRPIRARRPSIVQRANRWARRHRAFVWATLAVLVVLVAGLSVGTVLLGRAHGREKSARSRSEASLQLVRATLDRMVDRAADELAGQPHLEQLRRELLEDALVLHRDILAHVGREPSALLDAANAQRRIGDIYEMLGRRDEAREAYRRALARFEEIPPGRVDEAASGFALARLWDGLSRCEPDRSATVAALRRSLAHTEPLLARDPSDADYRRHVARVCRALGWHLWDTDRDGAKAAYERADRIWNELIEESPRHFGNARGLVDLLNDRARKLRLRHEYEAAAAMFRRSLEVIDEALARWPSHAGLRASRVSALCGLATAHRMRNRFDDATAMFTEAVRVADGLRADFPSVPAYECWGGETRTQLASTLRRQGQWRRAEQLAREAENVLGDLAREHADVADYRLCLARSHLVRGHALNRLGECEPAQEEFQRCLTELNEVEKASPGMQAARVERSSALEGLGSAYYGRRQHAEAVTWYGRCVAVCRELVECEPGVADFEERLAEAIRLRGLTLLVSGHAGEARKDYGEAIAILNRLLRKRPDALGYRFTLAILHNGLAWNHNREGRREDSKREYGTALRILDEVRGDDRPWWHRERGASLRMDLAGVHAADGEYDEAKLRLGEAVAIRRELRKRDQGGADNLYWLAAALHNLASARNATGQPREAEAACREAIEVQSALVAAQPKRSDFQRALIASRLQLAGLLLRDRVPEALAEYRRAIELAPDDAGLLDRVAWTLAVDSPDAAPEEALRLAERARELAPADPSIWTTLGVARYRAGKFEQSAAAATRAIELGGPREAHARVFLAMAKFRLGEVDAARKSYRAAVARAAKRTDEAPELDRLLAEARALLGER